MLAAVAVALFGVCVAETTYILTLNKIANSMSRSKRRGGDDFGPGYSVMTRSELSDLIEEKAKPTGKGKPPAGHSGLYL